jgi:hypothetical protein
MDPMRDDAVLWESVTCTVTENCFFSLSHIHSIVIVKKINLNILTGLNVFSTPEYKKGDFFNVIYMFVYVHLSSASTVGWILFIFGM